MKYHAQAMRDADQHRAHARKVMPARNAQCHLEEHIARVDKLLTDYVFRLKHARAHGLNQKKWMNKIYLLTEERNRYMLSIVDG
jgi:hypothetical protein